MNSHIESVLWAARMAYLYHADITYTPERGYCLTTHSRVCTVNRYFTPAALVAAIRGV